MRPSLCCLALLLSSLASLSAAQQPAASDSGATAPTTANPSATLSPQTPGGSQQGVQAPASTPAPQTAANTISQNVRLVVLDAVVVDAKGNAVTNLTRDDFHVSEQDQPQQVRNFYAPGFFTPKPDQAIDSTADLDRVARQAPVNIVLLDEFNTRFEDMAFARYSLKKFLEKQPGRLDTPTMLVAVDLQHFTVLHDYTQNKDAIISALDHHFAVYPWQVHEFSWIAERYSTAFNSLTRVAEASIGHPGHKNMIWIGRGLPSINLASATVDARNRVNDAIQRTVNELRDARVTLYTIDPAGVMVDAGEYGMYARSFAPFGGDPDFEQLAKATGGRSLHGRNDVDAEIGSAIRDGADMYSFSYRPTDSVADYSKFRRIKVTVDRPGLTVYTRQGYYLALGPVRPTRDGAIGRKLATELIDAGTTNMSYDAVHFRVHSTATDPNAFTLHLDPDTLAWYYSPDNSRPRWTNILLLVTTFDKKGKELKTDTHRMQSTAPANSPPTGRLNIALNLPYRLAPDPKAVRARFVVRVEANGRMGTADVTVGQPADTSSFGALADGSTPPAPASTTTNTPQP